MKKFILLMEIVCIFCFTNAVFASEFSNLEGLTTEQKTQLSQKYQQFKQENTIIEANIMDYNNKIAKIKKDTNKTPEQIAILISSYERNIELLKLQQKELTKTTDEEYKSIMTTVQYQQYKAQQIEVQDAFKKFLQK